MKLQPFQYRVDTLYKPMGALTNSQGQLDESSASSSKEKSEHSKETNKAKSPIEVPDRVRTPLKWPGLNRRREPEETVKKETSKTRHTAQSLDKIRQQVKDIFYQVNQMKGSRTYLRKAVQQSTSGLNQAGNSQSQGLRLSHSWKLPSLEKGHMKSRSYAAELESISQARENPIAQSLSLISRTKICGKSRLENQTIRNGVKELVLKSLDKSALKSMPDVVPNPELANFISMDKKYTKGDIEYREAFLFSWMRHYLKAYQNKQGELVQLKEYMGRRLLETGELTRVIEESQKELMEYMLNLTLVEEGLQFLDYCRGLLKEISQANRAKDLAKRKEQTLSLSRQETKKEGKYKGKEYRLQSNGMFVAKSGQKNEAILAVSNSNNKLNKNLHPQEFGTAFKGKEIGVKPDKKFEELQTPKKLKSKRKEKDHKEMMQQIDSESKSSGNYQKDLPLNKKGELRNKVQGPSRVEEPRKQIELNKEDPFILVNSVKATRNELKPILNRINTPTNIDSHISNQSDKRILLSDKFIKKHKHQVKAIAEKALPLVEEDTSKRVLMDSAISPIHNTSHESLSKLKNQERKKETLKLSRENSESNYQGDEERSRNRLAPPPVQKTKWKGETSLHSSSDDKSKINYSVNDEKKVIHELMLKMITKNEVEQKDEESDEEVDFQSKPSDDRNSEMMVQVRPKYRGSGRNPLHRDTRISQVNQDHSSVIFDDEESDGDKKLKEETRKEMESALLGKVIIRDDSNLRFIDSEESKSRIYNES